MIEMGNKTTSINIYRNAKLLMPRQIPIGGEMFTRGIADGLGISMADAEGVKISRASIPESAAASGLQQAVRWRYRRVSAVQPLLRTSGAPCRLPELKQPSSPPPS